MQNRRTFLTLLGGGVVAGLAGARLALAAAPTDRRFVLVVLRGAMDGLSAVPPYADPNYRALRGKLAIAAPGQADGAFDLDGRFGLHPKLATLKAIYDQRQLIVAHAVATPYRDRSHFDGQDLLENGTATPHAASNGWLNRALGRLAPARGVALGDQVPLVLRGDADVTSWAPGRLPGVDADFVARVGQMYQASPILLAALGRAVEADQMAAGTIGDMDMGPIKRRGSAKVLAEAAGKFLADPKGPRIAVLEINGWDTHAGQGSANGRLAIALSDLDSAMAALKGALGPAWDKTAILAATEFGRTASANGTGGTDHGTASAAFLLGGAIEGGRVLTEWPGLGANQLYQGRDLAPTLDLRALAKGVLRDHLGLPDDALAGVVFPGSDNVIPMPDLLRA